MKPIEVPPRHSSTPTCTRAIGACASAQRSEPARAAAANPATRSERRIRKTPGEEKDGSAAWRAGSLCHNGFHRTKKEARLRGPLRRLPLHIHLAVPMMMDAAAMSEADRLELDAGNAGGDIQAGLSLHADRLQCIGIARTADQEVAPATDADRRIGADPAITASKLAKTEPGRRRADRPGELRLRSDAEIEANAPDGRDIGFGAAARALEHTFQIGDRPDDKSDILPAAAFEDAGTHG